MHAVSGLARTYFMPTIAIGALPGDFIALTLNKFHTDHDHGLAPSAYDLGGLELLRSQAPVRPEASSHLAPVTCREFPIAVLLSGLL